MSETLQQNDLHLEELCNPDRKEYTNLVNDNTTSIISKLIIKECHWLKEDCDKLELEASNRIKNIVTDSCEIIKNNISLMITAECEQVSLKDKLNQNIYATIEDKCTETCNSISVQQRIQTMIDTAFKGLFDTSVVNKLKDMESYFGNRVDNIVNISCQNIQDNANDITSKVDIFCSKLDNKITNKVQKNDNFVKNNDGTGVNIEEIKKSKLFPNANPMDIPPKREYSQQYIHPPQDTTTRNEYNSAPFNLSS